ncbi:MAG: hypothetical protein IJ080_09490, partial [Oscillospiraceae bacterium]|nr:hypothetical protein [Oscillospiraceae bacterium]
MSSTIKCPHCGESFSISEEAYSVIVGQVRTDQFEQEVHNRLVSEQKAMKSAADLEKQEAVAQAKKELSKDVEGLKEELFA